MSEPWRSLFLLSAAGFFGWIAFGALRNGYIETKGIRVERIDRPFGFWFLVTLEFVFAALAALVLLGVVPDEF